MTTPDFWESAKPSKLGDAAPKWVNFDDLWVDEVKRGFKACVVFLWYPLYCTFSLFASRAVRMLIRTVVSRAHLQPDDEQLDLSGCRYGHTRCPE